MSEVYRVFLFAWLAMLHLYPHQNKLQKSILKRRAPNIEACGTPYLTLV